MSRRTKFAFIAIIFICIVVLGMIAIHFHAKNAPDIVQADECAQQQGPPIGDVGCYITVNGQDIYIVHGNALQPTWGHIEGFTVTENITGKKVAIKDHRLGDSYAISSSSDYVKLLH